MPKLHALVCVWNSEETIFSCLTALADFVDRIVILEGRWIGYEGTTIRSTDNTENEILRFIFGRPLDERKLQIRYIVATRELHQYESRNELLNEVPIGDYLMIIDSDEIVVSYPSNLRESLSTGAKGFRMIYNEGGNGNFRPLDLPRILRKTEGLHWTHNHRYLDDNNGPLVIRPQEYPVLNIKIEHCGEHKAMRPASERYKDWLLKFEQENP